MDKDRELEYYKNGFYFYLVWRGCNLNCVKACS